MMESLLREKLSLFNELKKLTASMAEISAKTGLEKLELMLQNRQKYIEKINCLEIKVNDCLNGEGLRKKASGLALNNEDCNEAIKMLKTEIAQVIKEIYETEIVIRKNITNEMQLIKNILNKPNLPEINIKF